VSAEVWLKLETLQETLSYKVRGALNAVLQLTGTGAAVPALVTASAGNHGRAMAFAAANAGVPLTVYVPSSAPAVKVNAIRALGACLIPCTDYDEAEARAKQHGREGSALYVSPYSHPDVIAGAGTVALEILERQPDADVMIAAIGGGGLITGLAIAAGERVETWGVEAEASCPFTRGLAAGRIVPIEVLPTLADGLAGNLDPDTITFDLVRRHVAGVMTVTEQEIAGAITQLVAQERQIAEGAAAVAVAGLLKHRDRFSGRRIAVVLSGANIDPGTLRQIEVAAARDARPATCDFADGGSGSSV
jgi:threonine dehydratase